MFSYLHHLISQHFDEITEKSLLHCHTKGLHSVMFTDTPEKTLRMFVSTPESDMWHNHELYIEDTPMSIAFHPHHCNITLEVLAGKIQNWQVVRDSGNIILKKFMFDSKLIGNGSGFHEIGYDNLRTVSNRILSKGEYESMPADNIHTVWVPRGTYAAWLVYEGKEDANYIPFSWSNHSLDKLGFDGLYQKTEKSDVKELLKIAGLG